MMNQEELAKTICIEAHEGQFRKDGVTPYSTHPIAVAESFDEAHVYHRIVGYLHDVVEDTHWTCEELINHGFTLEQVAAIDALTDREDEVYSDYIRRVSKNKIATHVKIADINHNLSSKNLGKNKVAKYELAKMYLYKVLNK